MDVRVFKGFSVSLNGAICRRRINCRSGGARPPPRRSCRQRELATDYSYDLGFGISYSFGSIFNNVVNPRFRNAGGFGRTPPVPVVGLCCSLADSDRTRTEGYRQLSSFNHLQSRAAVAGISAVTGRTGVRP